jgi:hypothetical protein
LKRISGRALMRCEATDTYAMQLLCKEDDIKPDDVQRKRRFPAIIGYRIFNSLGLFSIDRNSTFLERKDDLPIFLAATRAMSEAIALHVRRPIYMLHPPV